MVTAKEPAEVDDLDAGWDDEPDEPEEELPPGLSREEREARMLERKARQRAKAAAKAERRKARARVAQEKQKKAESKKREPEVERPVKKREREREREEVAAPARPSVRRDWTRMAIMVLAVIVVGAIAMYFVRR